MIGFGEHRYTKVIIVIPAIKELKMTFISIYTGDQVEKNRIYIYAAT